ncbi:hypothetical protein MUK42_19974 [Musa troglodytarum]|uniref:Wings apart-like protein C-terminal domain-containing protein n=1 Tax=Musa troglodytarum TaxID=320322 RepID=A0A9E7FWX2_9LILI|nr:hypothetical protein MUK42_19974 [Musa troglodytarum]
MIVRTYARRAARCGAGRSSSDPILLESPDADEDPDSAAGELLDLPFSQDCSHGRHAPALSAFSSQDCSSPWSFDPFDVHDEAPALPSDPPNELHGSDGPRTVSWASARDPSAEVTTSTLMEAQEFGEMMEHVDEVNFALDGLRRGQPVRVRRASLLSLLSACSTAQQRRLLRVQGMAKRIIDAILGLRLDDSPSTVAAAALFYVLASDVQDDHLLDSPSCIGFLLKLLNPTIPETTGDKASTFGSKLLGKHKTQVLDSTYKGLDSTSRAIFSKVSEILNSCKEIKSGTGNDDRTERPELSPKWIALLAMEKACLSTVSFEDASDMVKMPGGDFKEKLRELGGLDAIFDVLASCYSTLEAWHSSCSFFHLNDEAVLQSMLLLLKCLKVMENATFLSKDNQNHLLGMKRKLNSGGLQLSFVGVIINAIKLFSDFSLLQRNISVSNNEKLISEVQSLQVKQKLKDNNNETSDSHCVGCSGVDRDSEVKVIKICHKRQKSSYSQLEVSLSGSEMATDFSASVSCDVIDRSTGDSSANAGSMSERPHLPKSVKSNCKLDMHDPFAFDDGELGPSKWELLAKKKEITKAHEGALASKDVSNGCDLPICTTDDVLSQLTNAKNHDDCAVSHSSGIDEDSSLVGDCLLTSVKVLMNLTNDNPVGCQQTAACGGLHTMVSLIVNHFPSFDCFFQSNGKGKENTSSTNQHNNDCHLNNRHLLDYELDLLVALLGLLVNLVEKDSQNRLHLAAARVSASQSGKPESTETQRDAIPLLCSIFLSNQGNGDAKEERTYICDDEESLLQGAREAEMMIIEAYSALLLAFLSTESSKVREAIANCLPNQNLQVLVPVLERFVAFHLSLNMMPPETHSAVVKTTRKSPGLASLLSTPKTYGNLNPTGAQSVDAETENWTWQNNVMTAFDRSYPLHKFIEDFALMSTEANWVRG